MELIITRQTIDKLVKNYATDTLGIHPELLGNVTTRFDDYEDLTGISIYILEGEDE